jgi:hypothetical protein
MSKECSVRRHSIRPGYCKYINKCLIDTSNAFLTEKNVRKDSLQHGNWMIKEGSEVCKEKIEAMLDPRNFAD